MDLGRLVSIRAEYIGGRVKVEVEVTVSVRVRAGYPFFLAV